VVTDTGRVVVQDTDGSTPFDLPLSLVLGKMPQKVFNFTTVPKRTKPLEIPPDITPLLALERVLKLLDVGSKRFLTNKVDRSVTGLIAQQQCVGALQTPIADVAVLAQSHFGLSGIAVAVGEQPIKGLLNNAAQARMTVGECLTNMMFAEITKLEDVKASCNWMWAAKISDEGSDMWQTCETLCDCLKSLGVSIDGGKDSLSMAAKVGTELVRAPGEVTLTAYAVCPDVTKTVTPDIKNPGIGKIMLMDLSGVNSSGEYKNRLGGSALSTVFSQLGQDPADVDDIPLLKRAFQAMQLLVHEGLILSGHDRSDGGLIVTILEMAFAGNCGLEISLPEARSETGILGALFGEELGGVLEILPHNVERVLEIFKQFDVPCYEIGNSLAYPRYDVVFSVGGTEVLRSNMLELRMHWESTSFALEKLQCNSKCVLEEEKSFADGRFGPSYSLTFDVSPTDPSILSATAKHRVAIIRQEGTNGDREMGSAFYSAGLDPWDVNMNDLLENRIDLSQFRGLVFCGGFSFADCNDSAKGWAGSIRFNAALLAQFEAFKSRSDTFSLGICNGCQLMALLGWVPFPEMELKEKQPRFIHNESNRFESRWSAVQIMDSPSVLLKGMAGSTLGVWVAHGEGKAFFPDEVIQM
jgi:phosphoribosylformylglycinamidine synthase